MKTIQGVTRVLAGVLKATVLAGVVLVSLQASGHPVAQSEQVVQVTIKDFAYVTRQAPLRLNVPTVIEIRNDDTVRHDFGTQMFDGVMTRIESAGTTAYGRGVGGVFLEPSRSAVIRFTVERPGKFEFRCSIHPTMKGEILLMSVEAV